MTSKKMRKVAPKNNMEPLPSSAFPPKKGSKPSKGKPMPFKKGKKY